MVNSDNAVTVYNLRRPSAGIPLLKLTCAIFSLLQSLDIRLYVMHIPGIENTLSDAFSRMDRTGDYALRPDVFWRAIRILQVNPTIDLFASNENYKLQPFVAFPGVMDKGASRLDAFSLGTRKTGVPNIFPPVQLLDRVLERIQKGKVTCVIVVPQWTGQPWWTLFRSMAERVLELGSSKDVLIAGKAMKASPSKKELPPGSFLMAVLRPTP
jgi:hypothetical protein